MILHFVGRLKFEVLLALVALWSVLLVCALIVKSSSTSNQIRTPKEFILKTIEEEPPTTQSTDESPPPTPQDDSLQVVMGCDGGALGGMIAAVNSIASNTDSKLHFYLATNKEELLHLKTWIVSTRLHQLSYTLRDVDEDVRKVKIDLAEIFPEIQGKVAFFECDVILKSNILDLFETYLAPDELGAFVTDCSINADTGRRSKYSSHVNIFNTRIRFKLDSERCPFNTGVFLVNATNWREKKVAESLHYWLKIHKRQSITALQNAGDEIESAMLIELYNKTTSLDPLWNVAHLGSNSGPHSKQYMDTAKLIHWSGSLKPWNHRTPLADLWDKYFVPDPTGQFRPIRKRGFGKVNENSRGF